MCVICSEAKLDLLENLTCPDLGPDTGPRCQFMWVNRHFGLVLDFALLDPAVDEALRRIQNNSTGLE